MRQGAILVCVAMVAAGAVWAAEATGDVPEAAAKACFEGRWLLVQTRLDEAIDRLSLATELAPGGYAEAEQLLAKARARRAEAQAHHDRAAAALEQQKWDEAVQEIAAATTIFPKYVEAKALLEKIQQRAAAFYLAAGQERLEAGDLAGADVALGRAQDYVADLPGLGETIARVARRRIETALAHEQWGQALLWAREAAAADPKKAEYQTLEQAALERVTARLRFAVAPADPADDGPSAATATMAAVAWKGLSDEGPAFIQFGAAEAPAFTVRFEASKVDVRTARGRAEDQTYRYTVRKEEPNPEYERLSDLLEAAIKSLAELRTEVVQRPCYTCGGTGWLVCRTCGGKGTVGGALCPACAGSGRPGRVRCPLCGGTGWRVGILGTEVGRLEREVDRLRDQLGRTPARIVRESPADWPYVVEYYEKTGTVEASIRVTDVATGRAILADALRQHASHEDTAIQGANPAIGLEAKSLALPPDEQVREGLLEAAGKEAAARIRAAILKARATARQAESDQLLAKGKVAEAVEAGVEAALLWEPLDAKKAALLMKGLGDRLRIEERYPDAPPAEAAPDPDAPPAR